MLWSRVLALVVAAAYLGVAAHSGEARLFVGTSIFLVLPLAIIWNAESAAAAAGFYAHGRRVSGPSPAGLIRILGFGVLLTPAVVARLA